MKIKSRNVILAVLFVLYFLMRLYFSLQTEYFNSDYSYFALRQIEHIKDTGRPLIEDDLSFGGRTYVFMPFYYYLLAFFAKFFPEILIIKILNNFFASTLIIAVYLVSSKIMQNRRIAVITAIVSATIPVYIDETLNNISMYSIVFPCSFFLIYFFIQLRNDKKMLNYLIPLTVILVLTSPITILIVFGMIIFLILSYIENMPVERIELEFISFFIFFYLWANFIIYKTAFQEQGFSIIWENVPYFTGNYLSSISFLAVATSIGLLPLVFGIYTIYNYIMKKKSRNILLIISLFFVD